MGEERRGWERKRKRERRRSRMRKIMWSGMKKEIGGRDKIKCQRNFHTVEHWKTCSIDIDYRYYLNYVLWGIFFYRKQ